MYEGCDWSLLKDKSEIQLYVEFDGDYLFIYTDEAKTLLATYCMYEKNEYNSFLEAVKTNDFDGMEFTFPRHADGSCDYDEGAWKSARKSSGDIPLHTGKAMTTEENLRVHSFEKTTSPVLITLAAGTPVEILGVGEEETIDGITSKWVHVKVMPGTTGTDGRHMTGTMGGWCFGGLVSATEKEPESADAPATEHAEPVEESVISNPAPAVGKTAAVTENLRLRTDDDRTAEVVATLAAVTRVEILAVGREDTIDGIASNWVRVAVLGGATDMDGNSVAVDTQGWLFGGYLSDVEKYVLVRAAEYEDIAEVRRLIAAGADVNAKNNYGETALMWAARNNDTDMAELLLAAGADVSATDHYGWTALKWAEWKEADDIAELLKAAGAR